MIICKYKFDSSIYSNLIPEFNSGYTGYTVSDEVNGNIVTRTIECDTLPTRIVFGHSSSNSVTRDGAASLLEVSNINVDVTDAYCMFSNCSYLTTLDLSNFDTSNVTNMSYMFHNCNNLTQLDLSNFDTSNVTTMSYMFYNCINLTQLDVSGFNTSNVLNMVAMFHNCNNLTQLDVSNFNTSKVTGMHAMFWGCEKLTSLDVSNFDTSKVTSMTAFTGWLSNAKILNLNNLHVTDEKTIIDGDDRFLLSTVAEKIYLNDLDTLNTVMRFLPDRTGKESGKLVTTLRNKIPTETLTALASKNWKIVDLVAQYRYDANAYEDLIPEFNTEFTSDKYEVYDSVSEIVIDNIKWEIGYINLQGEIQSSTDTMISSYIPCENAITYVFDTPVNVHWFDGNKKYISVSQNSNNTYPKAILKPDDAKHFIVSRNITTGESLNITAKLITRSIESKNGDLPTSMIFGHNGNDIENHAYTGPGISLLKVIDLNTKELTTGYRMFKYCKRVESIDCSNWDTINVADMSAMFYHCINLTTLNVSNFNTSNVTATQSMFAGCQSLTTLDVRNFNTSNVTNMYCMFHNCNNLTQLDVSNFNTSKVTDMQGMFYYCNNLTQLDVSNFDTSKVTDMHNMFSGCVKLTQLDVSNFDTNKVTSMQGMFYNCTNLTQLDLSNFDTSSVTNMSYMFNYCNNLTSLDISNFNVVNVTDFTSFLTNTKIKLIKCLNPSTINTLIQYLPDKSSSSNGAIIIDNRDNLNTNELTSKNWSIISTSDEYIVAEYKYDKSIYFDFIPKFNSGYDSYFIYNEYNDEDDNIVTRKIVSNVLPTLMRFGRIYVSGETNTDNRTDSLLEVLDMSTRGLTSCHSMFRYNTNLTSITCNWNTSNVTTMQDMFSVCSNLTQLDVSNWNTSNVNNMSYMFYNCTKLTSLDVSNWNTSQVIDMSYMFTNCNNLTSLDLSNFNTNNVTNMGYMFNACVKLTQLDVSKFNTSNVTNMYSMFNNCKKLTQLDVSKFNTSNVTSMQAMFYGCTNLTSLDVSSFNTSDVTTMQSMFNGCNNLTQLDVSNFNTSNVNNMSYMFTNCTKLTQLDLSNFDTSKVTTMDYMFDNTSKLVNIGMLYCSPSTINTISSNLSNPTTVWINGNIIKSELTSYDNVTYKAYYYEKELLLNSPLLEGDKIVKKDGKIYHYHKMGKVVLDGMIYYLNNALESSAVNQINTKWYQTAEFQIASPKFNCACIADNLVGYNGGQIWGYDKEGISIVQSAGDSSLTRFQFRLNRDRFGSHTPEQINEWLQANPITVVYELANPYYELISEDKDLSLILPSTDNILTNNSLIPTNMNVKNNSMSTVGISNSSTYTVVFDKDTDNNIVVNLNGTSIETSDNRVEITTSNELRENELTFIGEGEISNVRILDGSVSGDNIPRESFEGLKSSFEDNKVVSKDFIHRLKSTAFSTENIITSYEDDTITLSTTVNYTASPAPCNMISFEGLTTGKKYAVTFTCDTDCTAVLAYSDTPDIRHTECDAEVTVIANTPCVIPFTMKNTYAKFRLVTCGDSVRKLVFSDFSIVEGDESTYEEVLEYNGKYKVEYKVTGKNKSTLLEEGVYYYYSSGQKASSITHDTHIVLTEPNKTYVVSFENIEREEASNLCFWDSSMKYIGGTSFASGGLTFTTPHNTKFVTIAVSKLAKAFQVEEGTTSTEYEPYKEYTKTFYLNSPLLEGDTIEDINGVATHVKRYDKVVLDGSEDEGWVQVNDLGDSNVPTCIRVRVPMPYAAELGDSSQNNFNVITNKYITPQSNNDIGMENSGYINSTYTSCYFVYVKSTYEEFKSSLQQNPLIIVYELASPQYEPISTESILCDSYVNGHLDFDSVIPIEKVEFKHINYQNYLLNCQYAHPNTTYTIQFESDNVGKLDMIHFAGVYLYNLNVVKGVNRYLITTPSQVNSAYFTMRGIGFNASNIQVVATERDNIGYFKGIQSSFEDKVIKGKNLFNKDKIVLNYAIDLNGTITNPSFEYHSTEYIECKPNTSYTCNFGTGIHYFDENKTWISYQNHSTLSPSNAKYLIKCILQTADLNRIQIEEGEYVTTYESYGDKYEVEVSMVGKNKFNGWKIGGIDWNTGENNNKETDRIRTDYIKVKPNNVYHLNAKDCYCELTHLFMYDFNKKFISFIQTSSTIFSIPTNCYYIKILNMNADTFVNYKNYNFQLEEGEVATEYEPYKETRETIYLNSPLLKGDRIEMYNGKLCHYHKMGKIVLDGSEDEEWKGDSGVDNLHTWRFYPLPDSKFQSFMKSIPHSLVYSDNLPYAEYKVLYGNEIKGISVSINGNINIRNAISSTVQEFKAWLQANPTTVVYELAEPYYEEITPEHNEFTIVSIGESSFTIDSGNVPADSEVTYNVNVKLLNDLEENMNSNTSSTNTDLTTILDDIINE